MAQRHLSGRVAWVTGGASGMGRACAVALAEAGADVAIGSLLDDAQGDVLPEQTVYLPTSAELEGARSELEGHGGRVYAAALDLCEDESVEAFHAGAVDALGPIDILVNAAGTWGDQPMVGHPDAFWHRLIDVNLNGPFRTTKRVLPGMIERGWGRIVNIGSTAATEGERHNAAYCAAKHGLLGLTRCVALESAPHGVTCNMVSPGHVDTTGSRLSTRQQSARAADEPIEDLVAAHAAEMLQGRLIEPEEIAATVAFLCSDDARSFTMENLRQSGAMLW
jgi:3-hydroxybutyrate dehydrogenase